MELSVIIPTFNEETTIVKTLDALSRLVNVDEIIIVDGGSTDQTLELIERYELRKPIRIVRLGEANRGKQFHEGTKHASHDIFWFLLADTRPAQGCAREIKKYMKYGEVAGGNFQVIYGNDSRGARFMMWLQPQLQSSGLIIAESAVFARRSSYEKSGGYAPLSELGDIDFAKRLQKRGEFVFVTKAVTTSSQRFNEPDFWSKLLGRLMRLVLFAVGLPARKLDTAAD